MQYQCINFLNNYKNIILFSIFVALNYSFNHIARIYKKISDLEPLKLLQYKKICYNISQNNIIYILCVLTFVLI
jgi:hypothetical protein